MCRRRNFTAASPACACVVHPAAAQTHLAPARPPLNGSPNQARGVCRRKQSKNITRDRKLQQDTKMAHQMAPSVNCSLDDIDLSTLKVSFPIVRFPLVSPMGCSHVYSRAVPRARFIDFKFTRPYHGAEPGARGVRLHSAVAI